MKIATPSSRSYSINDALGNKLTSAQEIADEFCSFYSSHGGDGPAAPDESGMDFVHLVNQAIAVGDDNPLNAPITMAELEYGLTGLCSKAFGSDLISNDMLKNLSQNNRKFLLYVFNRLLSTGYVPPSWKTAIVVPILKPGKIASSND